MENIISELDLFLYDFSQFKFGFGKHELQLCFLTFAVNAASVPSCI